MNKYVLVICILIHSLSIEVTAQDCQCKVSQVEENTVTPCNLIIGQEIIVNSVAGFNSAINQLNANGGNMTILIEDGDYQVASTSSFPYITGNNVVIRSLSGNRDAVILKGGGMVSTSSTEDGLLIAGNNVTIADLTIREVGNHGIQVSGHHLYVHNVRIQNTYEQMIKGSTSEPTIDSAIVQCSLFEYTDGIGPNWYIGGLDIHKGVSWIVRDNVFKNISSPSQNVAEHAVHFWNGSSDNTIERNLIINCDRGIGFGLGSSPNEGGIIRNNMIYNDGNGTFNDVGIGLETSPNTRVYNNTIFIDYFNAIEYRFTETNNVDIVNNLTNKAISSRNGGSASLNTNVTDSQTSWFVDTDSGDLHLDNDIASVVAQGTNLYAYVGDDYNQNPRPSSDAFDIGAHEYKFAVNVESQGEDIKQLRIYPNPSKGYLSLYFNKNTSAKIVIYNGMGMQILSQRIETGVNLVDISAQPSGLYHYLLFDGSKTLNVRGTISKE